MKKPTRWVGLDVHAETIAVAVAEEDGTVRSLGTIPNERAAVERMVRKLGDKAPLRVCYEAGPCGYVLYWQLTKLGIACTVVAPTLIPVKAGDRVKTDRRDAEKLARCHRSGDLTAVWVPDAEHEALRDLVRAREAATKDQLRARHRLGKFLLRHGKRRPQAITAWGTRHMAWLDTVVFEHAAASDTFVDYLSEVKRAVERIARLERAVDEAVEHAPAQMREVIAALQSLRGVAKIIAVTVAVEVGRLSRFDRPKELMGYSGLVPSEASSGGKTRRDHQDGQQSLATGPGGSRVVVSGPAGDVRQAPGAPARPNRDHQGHRLEGTASAPWALPKARRPRQIPAPGRHGHRPRAARLRMGHRCAGGEAAGCGGVAFPMVPSSQRPSSAREGAFSSDLCGKAWLQPAPLV